MGNMAKIAVIKDVLDVEIQEYPIPEPLDDGLVIKVEAAAICGSDQHNLTTKPAKPRTIGHEFLGKIVAMGKNANEAIHSYGGTLNIGDRIVVYPHITCGKCDVCMTYGNGVCVCDNDFMYGGGKVNTSDIKNNDPTVWPHFKGGFAEYVHIFANTYVWKVPDDMPAKIGVLLDPCAVAMRAVEQVMTSIGGLAEGYSISSRCLIIGAGPIGIMAGMILKEMGVEQLVYLDFLDEKLENAKAISGADMVINTSKLTLEQKVALVQEATCGGPNIVIGAANHPSATIEGLHMIRKLGTYVEIGAINADTPTLSNRLVFKKNVHLTSVSANTPACFNRTMRFLMRWKEIPFEKLVTHEFHTLEGLVPTAKLMANPDYLKGVLTFES